MIGRGVPTTPPFGRFCRAAGAQSLTQPCHTNSLTAMVRCNGNSTTGETNRRWSLLDIPGKAVSFTDQMTRTRIILSCLLKTDHPPKASGLFQITWVLRCLVQLRRATNCIPRSNDAIHQRSRSNIYAVISSSAFSVGLSEG